MSTPVPPSITPDDLRRIRAVMGWKQAEAAAKVGVSSNTWSRWEEGSVKPHPLREPILAKLLRQAERRQGEWQQRTLRRGGVRPHRIGRPPRGEVPVVELLLRYGQAHGGQIVLRDVAAALFANGLHPTLRRCAQVAAQSLFLLQERGQVHRIDRGVYELCTSPGAYQDATYQELRACVPDCPPTPPAPSPAPPAPPAASTPAATPPAAAASPPAAPGAAGSTQTAPPPSTPPSTAPPPVPARPRP